MKAKDYKKIRKGVIKAKGAKATSQTSPNYRRKTLNPREAIKNFNTANMEQRPKDFVETTTFYKRTKKINTEFYKATWACIFSLALLNAFAVFLAKVVVYEELGKPSVGMFTPSDEDLVHKTVEDLNEFRDQVSSSITNAN